MEKCCENCDFYQDAICVAWTIGDTVCIEEIECPGMEVCAEWEGDEDE